MFAPMADDPSVPVTGGPVESVTIASAEWYSDTRPKPGLLLTLRLEDGTETRKLFRYEADVRPHETRKGKPT